MSDPKVDKFKPTGTVAIWTYGQNRNFPGWHLSCDQNGADSAYALLKLMQEVEFPSRKTIPLANDIHFTSAPGYDAQPRFARNIEIRFNKGNAPDTWELSENNGDLRLVLGNVTVCELQQGIDDIRQGGGDYAIGDDPCLWFWWEVKRK